MSLTDKTANFISSKYAEFYYDHYLDKYIELDQELQLIEKPEKQQYINFIGNINYDIHPLFRKMYDNENIEKKNKNAIVNNSIKAFLETYVNTIDFTILTELFQSRQKDKIFVLWDLTKFHIETIEQDVVEKFVLIENNNKIVVEGQKYKYCMVVAIHKDNLADAYIFYLSDTKDEFLELMKPAFYSLIFCKDCLRAILSRAVGVPLSLC